jgi:type VI secretion system secreted protein Hcp
MVIGFGSDLSSRQVVAQQQDIHVKLDGIDGESKDSKHSGEIDVLGIGYKVSQAASMSSGGGGGVGKAAFENLWCDHFVDKATPNLLKFASSGKPLKQAVISVSKVGDGAQDYLTITLTDVLIAGVTVIGSTEDARLKERFELAYGQIKIEAKEQNADGSLGAAVTGAWNVKENNAA